MRIFLTFCLMVMTLSCAATTSKHYTQIARNWRGTNVQNLLEEWGAPDIKVPRAEGTTVYIYKKVRTSAPSANPGPRIGVNVSATGRPIIVTSPGTNPAWGQDTLSLTCVYTFIVNAKGIITQMQAKGSGC
jgi:hypothetical protein